MSLTKGVSTVNYTDTLKESMWLTLTTYYEARGENKEGQKAVVKVILNRVNKKNKTIKEIVLQAKQFSCFNTTPQSIGEVMTFANMSGVINEAIDEWYKGDTLGGATHYYAIKGMVGNKPPSWAAYMTFVKEIGGHRFLKET